jgi:hypothetical protein
MKYDDFGMCTPKRSKSSVKVVGKWGKSSSIVVGKFQKFSKSDEKVL